jgi:hypothetical protein
MPEWTDLFHVRDLAKRSRLVWCVMIGCGSCSGEPSPAETFDAAARDGVGGSAQEHDGSAVDGASSETGGCLRGPERGDLPCNVAAVLEICQNCHRQPPARGAPFPFLTYEDTQAVHFGPERRWQRMAIVIEPNAASHMPPRSEPDIPQLTETQLNTLRAWFRACTPPVAQGAGCDKGETP